jgi:hypothetical protein
MSEGRRALGHLRKRESQELLSEGLGDGSV